MLLTRSTKEVFGLQLDESIRELFFRLGDTFVDYYGIIVVDEVKFGRACYYALKTEEEALEELSRYDVPDGYIPGGQIQDEYLLGFRAARKEAEIYIKIREILGEVIEFERRRLGIYGSTHK
ncbi:MAG: hypothetical protein PHW75_02140 [Patescibacteria group bacterium]|nr:hypothetical protein [Patescibacteria group bacterium]